MIELRALLAATPPATLVWDDSYPQSWKATGGGYLYAIGVYRDGPILRTRERYFVMRNPEASPYSDTMYVGPSGPVTPIRGRDATKRPYFKTLADAKAAAQADLTRGGKPKEKRARAVVPVPAGRKTPAEAFPGHGEHDGPVAFEVGDVVKWSSRAIANYRKLGQKYDETPNRADLFAPVRGTIQEVRTDDWNRGKGRYLVAWDFADVPRVGIVPFLLESPAAQRTGLYRVYEDGRDLALAIDRKPRGSLSAWVLGLGGLLGAG